MNEQIEAAFKLFDMDKSGMIDKKDLLKSFDEVGLKVSMEEIEGMLNKIDQGEITL